MNFCLSLNFLIIDHQIGPLNLVHFMLFMVMSLKDLSICILLLMSIPNHFQLNHSLSMFIPFMTLFQNNLLYHMNHINFLLMSIKDTNFLKKVI